MIIRAVKSDLNGILARREIGGQSQAVLSTSFEPTFHWRVDAKPPVG